MKIRLACLLTLAALAACEELPPVVVEPFPSDPFARVAPRPAEPSGPLVIAEPPPGALGELEGLPDPAVATCMSAVAQQAGNPVVAPVQVAQGVSGTTVLVGVGETRAPWECRVDQTGAVVGVTSLTDEGAL
jgi:hypothetical protein